MNDDGDDDDVLQVRVIVKRMFALFHILILVVDDAKRMNVAHYHALGEDQAH